MAATHEVGAAAIRFRSDDRERSLQLLSDRSLDRVAQWTGGKRAAWLKGPRDRYSAQLDALSDGVSFPRSLRLPDRRCAVRPNASDSRCRLVVAAVRGNRRAEAKQSEVNEQDGGNQAETTRSWAQAAHSLCSVAAAVHS